MSNNIRLLHIKDEEKNIEEIKKGANKINETNSQAIYRISPILIKEDNGLSFPLISAENTHKHNLIKENYVEKFSLSEDQKFENDYKLINIATNKGSEDNHIELRLPEDEEEPRKYYDKYNLYNAFYFSCDPLSSKSEFIDEDEEIVIKYESIEDKLTRIFGITV
jgi:hypothetical protein